MSRFLERNQIVEGFLPVNMATADNTSDWVSLKAYKHITVVHLSAAGAAAEPPTVTVLQAQDVSGTASKALDFTTGFVKQAATNLRGTGQWTKVTQAAGNTYTSANNGDKARLWVFEFDSDQLDVDNGFDCVQANIADVGNTSQLGCIFYILSEPRYPAAAENMLSALAD